MFDDHETETEQPTEHTAEPAPFVFPTLTKPANPPAGHRTAVCQRDFDVPINGTPTQFVTGETVTDEAALAAFDEFQAPVAYQEA